MVRRFTRAVRVAEAFGAVLAGVVLAILFLPRLTGGGSAASSDVNLPNLNVAVVPAVDSAGFFVALRQGLFTAHGLHVTFIPAVSSETVINAQALDQPGDRVDISCGNYVSYIQAQENYDQGKRPTSATGATVAADLDIFAEGSVMEPGAQGLYVLPGSQIRSMARPGRQDHRRQRAGEHPVPAGRLGTGRPRPPRVRGPVRVLPAARDGRDAEGREDRGGGAARAVRQPG